MWWCFFPSAKKSGFYKITYKLFILKFLNLIFLIVSTMNSVPGIVVKSVLLKWAFSPHLLIMLLFHDWNVISLISTFQSLIHPWKLSWLPTFSRLPQIIYGEFIFPFLLREYQYLHIFLNYAVFYPYFSHNNSLFPQYHLVIWK